MRDCVHSILCGVDSVQFPVPSRLIALVLLMVAPTIVTAHSTSTAFLRLSQQGSLMHGEWLIGLRDLDWALDLDTNRDAKITWGEVRAKHAEIRDYALAHLLIESKHGTCTLLAAAAQSIEFTADGADSVLPFSVACVNGDVPARLQYSLLFDGMPNHRVLLRYQHDDVSQVFVLSKAQPEVTFGQPAVQRLIAFVRDGVLHIWGGYDHLLFLLALLVPITTRRGGADPTATLNVGWRWMLARLFATVTAFTVAHSLTLAAAAFELVNLPTGIVECVIALSVAIAGLNVLVPIFRDSSWLVAFAFGLVHGFGFATALNGLHSGTEDRLAALFGFNVGVEVGQFAVVLVSVPVLCWIGARRRTALFLRPSVALVICGTGITWALQRGLAVM
jgi:hypothetical protein